MYFRIISRETFLPSFSAGVNLINFAASIAATSAVAEPPPVTMISVTWAGAAERCAQGYHVAVVSFAIALAEFRLRLGENSRASCQSLLAKRPMHSFAVGPGVGVGDCAKPPQRQQSARSEKS